VVPDSKPAKCVTAFSENICVVWHESDTVKCSVCVMKRFLACHLVVSELLTGNERTVE
jgi:hypothetical protein